MAKRGSREGLFKRGRVWWLHHDPVTGRPISTRCETKEGARNFKYHRQKVAANPSYAASNEASFGEWAEKMLAVKKRDNAVGTYAMYAQKLGHLTRFIGEDTKLVNVTPTLIDQYRDHRFAEGAHHHSISKEFTALRQILKMASRAGAFHRDLSTMFPIGFGIGYTPRETVLTVEAEARLKLDLKPHQWAPVAFILATSARYSEAMSATANDWDPVRRVMLLRGKKTAGSHRLVPIMSHLQHYIDDALPHMPFRWVKISQSLPLMCARRGLDRITPNDLRRTCATRLIERGADPYLVAKITGHVDLKMLRKVYDQSSPEKVRVAIEAQMRAAKEED